jgi:diacylglycerol O-acyltransferase / wax synthase
MMGRAALGIGRRSPLANCTITNVPGPSVPLYLCGARMSYFSAIMPISDGMGLVFAVTSYDGRIIISPTSCRELMPDPAVFAQCVRDSFQEYLAAALAAPPQKRAKRTTRPVPGRPAAKPARARVSSTGTHSRSSPPA